MDGGGGGGWVGVKGDDNRIPCSFSYKNSKHFVGILNSIDIYTPEVRYNSTPLMCSGENAKWRRG